MLFFAFGLGFNFSAISLLTSSSAFYRSDAEWKSWELIWLLAEILIKFELNPKADGPTIRSEIDDEDASIWWFKIRALQYNKFIEIKKSYSS